MTWSPGQIAALEATVELRIAARRPDGTLRRPVPVWVVRVGDELYVRSYLGTGGAWFRDVLRSGEAHIEGDGVEAEAALVAEPDPAVNEQVDAAYRTKYADHDPIYVDPMLAPVARAATLRLRPR